MDERLRRTLEAYETGAADYEERNADRSVVADLVERFLGAVEGDRVLDVGCGPGWETATFARAGYDAVGFDLTPAFVRRTRERAPAAAVARGDMRTLPFAGAAFDGVWACASPLHVPRADFRPTLREFRRVLAPGGVLCLSMQRLAGEREASAPASTAGDGRHFEFYGPDALREHLAAADLAVTWQSTDGEWVQVLASPETGGEA